jgi:SPP1 family predicted phage head-tail adaptor|nr:MAG TPA: head tail joining protein [Caudoviricetes sp.]
MDFSRMRHRITFLKPMGTQKNSMGESVPTYTDYKTVWAFVAPKTGREYDEAQKLRAETTFNVHTRFFSDITAEMQIRYKDHILKIESVLNINERNEELLIVASEVDTSALLTSSKADTDVSSSHLGGA